MVLSIKILCEKESGNNTKETEDDEDMFCDAQCNFIKSINFEIDTDSDEEEFWDAQSELEGHDEGTLDPKKEVGSSINILNDKLVEDKKEAEADNNPQQNKYNGSRNQRKRKLGPNLMLYISCFRILSSNITLCAENKTSYVETKKIRKGNIKPEHQNRSVEQRLDKRHIDEGSFKAFMCNE